MEQKADIRILSDIEIKAAKVAALESDASLDKKGLVNIAFGDFFEPLCTCMKLERELLREVLPAKMASVGVSRLDNNVRSLFDSITNGSTLMVTAMVRGQVIGMLRAELSGITFNQDGDGVIINKSFVAEAAFVKPEHRESGIFRDMLKCLNEKLNEIAAQKNVGRVQLRYGFYEEQTTAEVMGGIGERHGFTRDGDNDPSELGAPYVWLSREINSDTRLAS